MRRGAVKRGCYNLPTEGIGESCMAAEEWRVPAGELRELCASIFERCGMLPEDAALVSESLVQADLGGTHSHGVLRVPEYARKLTVGGGAPRGRPSVVRDAGAAMVVDGGNSRERDWRW